MFVWDPFPNDVAFRRYLVERLIGKRPGVDRWYVELALTDQKSVAVREPAEIMVLSRLSTWRLLTPFPDYVAVPVEFKDCLVKEKLRLPVNQHVASLAVVDCGVNHFRWKTRMWPGSNLLSGDVDKVSRAVATVVEDVAFVCIFGFVNGDPFGDGSWWHYGLLF